MRIPAFDLTRQYKRISNDLLPLLEQVLSKGQFILGENVHLLEQELADYCNVKYGLGVASGTDALLISLEALGVKEGDEVITTPFTFFATSEVISLLKAKPVFVDIDPTTYNIDPEKVEDAISPKTKGIIPVHLFGQMAEMDDLTYLAEKYDLFIVEDACQAIGAEYKGKKAGSIGNTGCFSFFPTKNLGGYGDGGFITTNDEKIYEKIKLLRVHGSSKKYYHDIIGHNSRLDEIQAVILRVKLKYLDSWIERRREIAKIYSENLKNFDIVVPEERPYLKHVYHQYVIRVKKRDELQNYLSSKGIGTAIYYPLPLHLQKCYEDLGYKKGDFPEAEKASEEVLALPMWPELTDEEVYYVIETVREFYDKYGG
ncbi:MULTISPECIES: DegT/DnrJ/EryC1/StrS family aminotransferase [Dictyoglomus]|jgi:dTDP-4-amino-4,6-dideoxygalactose transaminase|uniref:Glutamine--scyllo-inositol transaminase n=1 Tax=Dictyoglomus turgidum (strain DSM 6724 / Z-1310) TaxID=515635 RepID=B8E0I2_DICTD|nr:MULTISPECIES: DegT/DnrJ/EryC1/StrS family aminotransferase [Dictyoglomus]ACK42627.1 Glutamine--scyllo-inositol transaminase [Dictyoglomus turgidum DSM 6724]PNV80509.1 MAG: DegT/DnrJ/EryC1/StrS family aminotransferase [Dictyoglomus turgidum]HBU31146.1 DegT/DnrJ/EryC1/StrS family aminotransferase [Dictyoglomus sp.]